MSCLPQRFCYAIAVALLKTLLIGTGFDGRWVRTSINRRAQLMTSTGEHYCQYGFACLELAQTTDDPKVKAQLVARAESWRQLAEKDLENLEDPVEQIEQWITEREWKLAEIDAALADLVTLNLDRSHSPDIKQIDTRFERAVGRQTLRQASTIFARSKDAFALFHQRC